MLSLESARAQILSRLIVLPVEQVKVLEAHGRFLAEPLLAPGSLPPFDNSAMDGYAVRAADVAGASPESPARLRLIGRAPAGETAPPVVDAGACARVFTGAPLPPGADAVVMQEDTRFEGGADSDPSSEIAVLDAVKPWENVRFKGEDVKQGQAVLAAGDRLTAARLGLAAALGVTTLAVRSRPRVGLLATGNELVEAGQECGPGKIYESNRTLLAPLVASAGGVPRAFPLVPDTLEATKAALLNAWNECEVLLTSGGVSVGDHDYVKPALTELGGTLEFWKVAVKPGKPFVFGQWNGKLLFGLPGNPVSALVTFRLLVRPALLCLQGAKRVEPPWHWATAGEVMTNPGDRRHFVRARLDDAGQAWLSGPQASHRLGSLAAADGLVDLPAGATVAAGTPVTFLPMED